MYRTTRHEDPDGDARPLEVAWEAGEASLAPGDTCAIPPDQLVSLAPSMSGEASLFRVINTDDAAGPTSDFHPLPAALG